MIYAVPIENYPGPGHFIEEHSYMDENMFEWRIARIKNGFMVRYFGHSYFQEPYFECDVGKEHIRVRNTNCIFFQDEDFESFCLMRDILKNGYTDEIHDSFVEFFEERFEHDRGMLESEIG